MTGIFYEVFQQEYLLFQPAFVNQLDISLFIYLFFFFPWSFKAVEIL